MDMVGPAAKRPRFSPGMMESGGLMGMAGMPSVSMKGACKGGFKGGDGGKTGNPHKDKLIGRINAYQCCGEEFKEAWWRFCDEQLGGIRDPARLEIHNLVMFCNNHSVP